MTLLVAHRRNGFAELAATPAHLGIEVDVRTRGDRLVVTHDPFTDGPLFARWLDGYHHAFLVVNVKEEGLVHVLEEHLRERQVEHWTYLDQSFPFLVRTLRRGESRCAVRVSEYETVHTAVRLADPAGPGARPEWVWLDSFTGQWPAAGELSALHDAGFKIMVVSPELQGRPAAREVDLVRERFAQIASGIDAVCTKQPELWS